jgi:hypothetical protein
MSNKKITDLTELVSPTIDDVFPVVDIATNTTQKAQLGNLPVQTAVTTALATKQDTLVSGTNIKTVNSNSLLGAGDVAVQETLVSGTNIKTLNSVSLLGAGNIVLSATPSGVAGAIQFSNGSAFASDATNLFWDDTNNRLGVGTNAPTATAHFRGIGNTSLTTALLVQNSSLTDILSVTDNAFVTINSGFVNIQTNGVAAPTGGAGLMFNLAGSGQGMSITNQNAITYRIGQYAASNVLSLGSSSAAFNINTSSNIGIGLTNPTARTHIQGSGSTSATTSLLVQNSAGATSLQVTDDGVIQGNSGTQLRYRFGGASPMGVSTRNGAFTIGVIDGGFNQGMQFNVNSSSGKGYIDGWATFDLVIGNNGNPVQIGTDSSVASAQLTVNSTTKGFMPPRMTTTQRDNIVGVAAGLIIYNSVTNKLQCYDGSTWNDLF